jgi:ACS family pantothenate transporter-like MFS transporter
MRKLPQQTKADASFNSWLPAVIFLQTDGPSFRKGFPTVMASNILACIGMVVIQWFHRRQLVQEAAAQASALYEESAAQLEEKAKMDEATTEVAAVLR